MQVEVVAGSDLPVMNTTELATGAIAEDPNFRELARQMSSWVSNVRNAAGRSSMFDRGMFSPPDNPYNEILAARDAIEYDDVVSGALDVTESFAFQGIKWESEDPETSDVFNQIARDLDLDNVVRQIWREEFGTSQAVCAFRWGTKTYTLRGRTPEGKRRKKKITLYCPVDIRVLDSAKIVPLNPGPLGPDVLAWQATDEEINQFQAVADGTKVDIDLSNFFIGTYNPSRSEAQELRNLGVRPDKLLVMNPDYVVRHCPTKADYMRFAPIRLKSLFSLLDLKRQLVAADRAALVGSANYILLIRKGSKEEPAKQGELDNLQENYQVIAKMPVIISDHRLSIDIIAPATDLTLSPDKYDLIDARITARLLGMLTVGTNRDNSQTLGMAVARGMENRRHMLRRFLERNIARAIVEHPRNDGLFEDEPNLVYTPRNINLGFDTALIQAILSLRSSRDISRETILEFVGLDQATEALRREIEADLYDEVFQTLAMPGQGNGQDPSGDPNMPMDHGGPNGNGEPPSVAGGKGGRPVGGGKPAANPAKVTPKTPSGASTKRSPK